MDKPKLSPMRAFALDLLAKQTTLHPHDLKHDWHEHQKAAGKAYGHLSCASRYSFGATSAAYQCLYWLTEHEFARQFSDKYNLTTFAFTGPLRNLENFTVGMRVKALEGEIWIFGKVLAANADAVKIKWEDLENATAMDAAELLDDDIYFEEI